MESKSTTITISIPTLLVVSSSGLTGLQVQVRFELDNPGNTLCLTSNGLPGQLILSVCNLSLNFRFGARTSPVTGRIDVLIRTESYCRRNYLLEYTIHSFIPRCIEMQVNAVGLLRNGPG